jgi:uncharacterized protein (TIGR00369 family)
MVRFDVPDAAYAERIRASFARQRIMALLGAEIAQVEPGSCTIRLPFREDLTQQHGYVHGGIVGTIADSAAGYAGMTLAAAGTSVLTVEYKLNLLAPAEGEALVARGRVVRPGRTLVITQADVATVRDGQEHHCATLLQTLMVVQAHQERG